MAPRIPVEVARQKAWHDATCPEGSDCASRDLHALSAPVVSTGILDRYHKYLAAITGGCDTCILTARVAEDPTLVVPPGGYIDDEEDDED